MGGTVASGGPDDYRSLVATLTEANQALREIRDAIQAADRRNLKTLGINEAARGARRLCETEND